jgi:CCR4-NOT transcription complex subunit 1
VESDPAGFQNRVSTLFKNWYQICELPGANETACSQYVLHLHQTGLLKGDDTTESFFRILLELSVAHCISSEDINSGAVQSPQQPQSPSFLIIDMYAKLVFSILKVECSFFFLHSSWIIIPKIHCRLSFFCFVCFL